jgi:hypothetical protein
MKVHHRARWPSRVKSHCHVKEGCEAVASPAPSASSLVVQSCSSHSKIPLFKKQPIFPVFPNFSGFTFESALESIERKTRLFSLFCLPSTSPCASRTRSLLSRPGDEDRNKTNLVLDRISVVTNATTSVTSRTVSPPPPGCRVARQAKRALELRLLLGRLCFLAVFSSKTSLHFLSFPPQANTVKR